MEIFQRLIWMILQPNNIKVNWKIILKEIMFNKPLECILVKI